MAVGSGFLELIAIAAWFATCQVSISAGFSLTMEINMEAHVEWCLGMLAVLWGPGGSAEPRRRWNSRGIRPQAGSAARGSIPRLHAPSVLLSPGNNGEGAHSRRQIGRPRRARDIDQRCAAAAFIALRIPTAPAGSMHAIQGKLLQNFFRFGFGAISRRQASKPVAARSPAALASDPYDDEWILREAHSRFRLIQSSHFVLIGEMDQEARP